MLDLGSLPRWDAAIAEHLPPRGAVATIEYTIPPLCVTSGNPYQSGISAWVALTGNSPYDSGGRDIYQIGYIKCQSPGCPSLANYVWAYGHEAGTGCGPAENPAAHFLGTAGTGTYPYKVERTYQYGRGYFYAVYINGSEKNWQSLGALDNCWLGGPKYATYADEVFNTADYNPGGVANPQDWTSVKYKNGLNRPGFRGDSADWISRGLGGRL